MDHVLINEGLVHIRIPPFEKVSSRAPVFYNPVMELNRDLSVLALQQFKSEIEKGLSICDAFGGSGIRGIRYGKEVSGVDGVVINDVNPLAVSLARDNSLENGLDNVTVCQMDANLLLRLCKGKFNVVDIDPFGTPSPFIDSVAVNLPRNSMLAVTATDTSALCGTYPEPCIRKYGSNSLKTEYCHENGLRILAGYLSLSFARYRKFLTFKFSHSTEHYLRLYATISKGAKKTDKSLKNMGYIAHCPSCLNRQVYRGMAPIVDVKCTRCNHLMRVAGPLWCGDIQDSDFISGMIEKSSELVLNQEKNAIKLLELCKAESGAPPTFYDIHTICSKLKISAPPLKDLLDRLKAEDHMATPTHFTPTGIKTSAPLEVVESLVEDLVKKQKFYPEK
ncbi:MAG TPA: tRNA (guanine(10)-N(2))-dimethyltransferase [Methanobacteriaceae archaeon]|nr:tRNA (guanine(10)-N(2))-dimethyltransferase [Methanobacteriaceae archaeon]